MNNINIILLSTIIVLIIIKIFFSQQIENFVDYYSECEVSGLLENVVKGNGMKNNKTNWDYYFPCEYNTCEEKIKTFENQEGTKKIFLVDGCDWPASKIALWKLLKEHYGNDEAAKLMPQTYLLDDPVDLLAIKTHFKNNKEIRKNFMYILKNYAQRQEGLKIVTTYKEIMEGYKEGFYLVQDYLYNPFLINKHKINFRYYTLIVCRNGIVEGYIHRDGFVYYTPEYYDENDPAFHKHITTGYIDRKIYDTNPLTLDDFRKKLETMKKGSSTIWDKNVARLMHDIIEAVSLKICKNNKLKKHTLFMLFGSDVAPTADLLAYLMEINKGPDLDAKDERDKKVKTKVQEDIFKVIEITDEQGKPFMDNRFERVY